MGHVWDFTQSLTLYKSAFLKRVPFQLYLHFTGAIHSIITFGNKVGSLVLHFFKFIDFCFVVGVPTLWKHIQGVGEQD